MQCWALKPQGNTATPKNAVSGFKTTGIFPFNPDAISENAFALSNISKRPLTPNSPDVPVQLDTNSAIEKGYITSNVSSAIQSTPVSDMSSSVSGSAALNVSFHDIMSSPKIRRSIRKSINSQAILVTKNLFTTFSKSKSGKSKKTIGPIADRDLQEARPSGVETRTKGRNTSAKCDVSIWRWVQPIGHLLCDAGYRS